MTSFSLDS